MKIVPLVFSRYSTFLIKLDIPQFWCTIYVVSFVRVYSSGGAAISVLYLFLNTLNYEKGIFILVFAHSTINGQVSTFNRFNCLLT